MALGRYFKHQSERVRRIRDDPKSAKAWEAMFLEEAGPTRSISPVLIARDPDVLMKEAEAAVRADRSKSLAICPHHGDSPEGRTPRPSSTRSASCDAASRLRRSLARTLTAGRSSSATSNGRWLWSTSGQPHAAQCRDMNAYERPLVKRMQGKPFALLGANRDRDDDKLREWIEKEEITWPSWRDGNGGNARGPIFRQFNIRRWPTLYILDHRGVIRHKFLDPPGNRKLDAAIDALIQEAEREAARSKKN